MLNVVVLELPAGILPVSQTPVSLVDVCAIPSVFFHVIVVPTDTVMVAGENVIPDITTVLGGAAGGGVGLVGVEPYGFDELLLQPELIKLNAKIATSAVVKSAVRMLELRVV